MFQETHHLAALCIIVRSVVSLSRWVSRCFDFRLIWVIEQDFAQILRTADLFSGALAEQRKACVCEWVQAHHRPLGRRASRFFATGPPR